MKFLSEGRETDESMRRVDIVNLVLYKLEDLGGELPSG